MSETAPAIEKTPPTLAEKLQVMAFALFVYHLVLTMHATRVDRYDMLLHPDANNYTEMTQRIREGNLTLHTFTHGVGMPLLGLVASIEDNRFTLPSMILFAVAVLQLYLLLRLFLGVGGSYSALIGLLATMPSTEFFISSASNIITGTLLLSLAVLILYERTLTPWLGFGLGFLFGLDFAARYVDPVLLLPALLLLLARTLARDRLGRTCKALGTFLAGSLPWLAVVLYFHHAVLGNVLHTPYRIKPPFNDRIGVGTEGIKTHLTAAHYYNDIHRNFYQLFVNPRKYALRSDICDVSPVFSRMPYLAFFFLGLYYLFRRRRPRWPVVLTFGVMGTVTFVFYMSIWPMSAHDMKYGCLRYLQGWYGLWGIVSIFAITELFSDLREMPRGDRWRHLTRVALASAIPLGLIAAIEPIDKWQIRRGLLPAKQVTLKSNRNPQRVTAALDGRLDTFWDTGGPMRQGDWLEIRLARPTEVSQIRFDLREDADEVFPWRIVVFYDAGDGEWKRLEKLRTGRQNFLWRLTFPRRVIRALRIEVATPYKQHPWRIYELWVRR